MGKLGLREVEKLLQDHTAHRSELGLKLQLQPPSSATSMGLMMFWERRLIIVIRCQDQIRKVLTVSQIQ